CSGGVSGSATGTSGSLAGTSSAGCSDLAALLADASHKMPARPAASVTPPSANGHTGTRRLGLPGAAVMLDSAVSSEPVGSVWAACIASSAASELAAGCSPVCRPGTPENEPSGMLDTLLPSGISNTELGST